MSGVQIKWSTWGNPGEIQRFNEYTAAFNERTGAKVQLIPQPEEYEAKLMTQLSGGTAPDLFYSGDTTMSKLIASGAILELTELVQSDVSKSPPDEVTEGLWGPARTEDGKIWGMPVDCNPLVFWYNQKLLTDAGVTEMPADLYEEGQWTWEALSTILDQVKAAGKRGLIQDKWFGPMWGWVTTNGGTVFNEEQQFVAHEDPKAIEAFQFILDNIRDEKFTYSGALPKGQGADAMFLSQQVAFVLAGRWYLPIFKQATGLEYNIVPWPTNTGKKIEPAPIATAYMVQNANAQNPEAAFALLTDFVSAEGQKFRLKGGGNAVPSVSGADEVVAEGGDPENWQFFIDARDIGYAIWPGLANYAGLGTDIEKVLDETFLKGGEAEATLQRIAELVEKAHGAA